MAAPAGLPMVRSGRWGAGWHLKAKCAHPPGTRRPTQQGSDLFWQALAEASDCSLGKRCCCPLQQPILSLRRNVWTGCTHPRCTYPPRPVEAPQAGQLQESPGMG